jgi:hypothetical protein
VAKSNAAKGAKKGRRFNQPRSEAAKRRCAERKDRRRQANAARHKANVERIANGDLTPWQLATELRAARREHLQDAA